MRVSQRSPISDGTGIARSFAGHFPTVYGHACRLWPEVQASMSLSHPSRSWTLTALVRLHTKNRAGASALKSTPASEMIPQLPSMAQNHVAASGSEAVSDALAHAASVPPNQAQAGSRDMGSAAAPASTARQPTEPSAAGQHTGATAAGSEAAADLPSQLQHVVQPDARTQQQNQAQSSALQGRVGVTAGSLSQQHCTANRMQSHSSAAQHSQASTMAYTGTTQQYHVPQNASQLPTAPVISMQPLSARTQDAGHALVQSAVSPAAAAEELYATGQLLNAPQNEAGPSNSQVRETSRHP